MITLLKVKKKSPKTKGAQVYVTACPLPDPCFSSLFIEVSSVVNESPLSWTGKRFILLTPVVTFRSLESRKEREQVSHPGV